MLSIIIPLTGKNKIKYANTCIHFLNKQTLKRNQYEIILIEQINSLLGGNRAGGPFYQNVKNIDKYIAIKDPGENHFNQSWIANVGARIARGNKLLFLNVDMICNKSYLEAVSKFNAPHFLAWNKVYRLSEQSSNQICQSLQLTNAMLQGIPVHKAHALKQCGSAVCSMKDFYWNKLGGYNENYLGWGEEDVDIATRAFTILKRGYILNQPLHHLWHLQKYVTHMKQERNKLIAVTRARPMEITKKLRNANLGNKNKQTYIKVDELWNK
jgi:predicted glycosyltransferase involved in capsule biosynthesis